jgi:hypothetical protein
VFINFHLPLRKLPNFNGKNNIEMTKMTINKSRKKNVVYPLLSYDTILMQQLEETKEKKVMLWQLNGGSSDKIK